jgi:hypothetical protein
MPVSANQCEPPSRGFAHGYARGFAPDPGHRPFGSYLSDMLTATDQFATILGAHRGRRRTMRAHPTAAQVRELLAADNLEAAAVVVRRGGIADAAVLAPLTSALAIRGLEDRWSGRARTKARCGMSARTHSPLSACRQSSGSQSSPGRADT